MISFQSFRYELVPTGEQVRNMRQFAGGCRVVWNKALAKQQEIHAAGGKFVGYAGIWSCPLVVPPGICQG